MSEPAVTASPTAPSDPTPAFAQLEQEFDARLGVYALDPLSRAEVDYRADQRFAYRVDLQGARGGHPAEDGARRAARRDRHVRRRRAAAQLADHRGERRRGHDPPGAAEAAVRFSDNTAGNIVLDRLGGPEGFTRPFATSATRRAAPIACETELNSAIPGDTRDTSTPRAFALDLATLLTTDDLGAAQQSQLIDWMTGNTTGSELIAAGLDAGWSVADKSGAGAYGTRNDIALVWPPSGSPIVLVIMSNRASEDADYDNALIARATEAALAGLGY